MPQNTPMKMQWITVDGRQTPIVLPQIWNHEKQDWEVTSDQNRLPVDARLTGSIAEYMWMYSDDEPFPSENRAVGIRINEDNSMATLYWNGTVWGEVT